MASNDISNFIQVQREQFVAVCSDPQIQFEREAYFALQILQGNDCLSKVAKGNQGSLKNAIINVAAIGISLNPAKKLAYLVPRDQKVCLDISYMGLMHIAQQTGAIYWAQSSIVMASDVFELQGLDKAPVHKFNPFSKDRGEIIGVYVTVKTGEGDYLTHTMTIDAVHDIRNRSAAWKSYVANKTKCPWVTDTEEMIKKTCVKQGSKYWPRRDRLDQAIHYLNTEAGEGLADLEPDHRVNAVTAPEDKVLPSYTEAQMIEKSDGWAARFKAGSSSPEHIISMICSKYILTEEQKSRIMALKVAERIPGEDDDK